MGGTAAAPIWTTMRGMYDSAACAMLPIRLTVVAQIKKLQKNRTARWWDLWVISAWVVIVPFSQL